MVVDVLEISSLSAKMELDVMYLCTVNALFTKKMRWVQYMSPVNVNAFVVCNCEE